MRALRSSLIRMLTMHSTRGLSSTRRPTQILTTRPMISARQKLISTMRLTRASTLAEAQTLTTRPRTVVTIYKKNPFRMEMMSRGRERTTMRTASICATTCTARVLPSSTRRSTPAAIAASISTLAFTRLPLISPRIWREVSTATLTSTSPEMAAAKAGQDDVVNSKYHMERCWDVHNLSQRGLISAVTSTMI